MNKHLENGFGKKILIAILIFLIILFSVLIAVRIVYFRSEQVVLLIDGTCGTSFGFIIRLGFAISKNRYGEHMKGFDDENKSIGR